MPRTNPSRVGPQTRERPHEQARKRLRDGRCALRAAALAGLLAATSAPALAQKAYPSAERAADALVEAIATNDDAGLKSVLGPDFGRFIPLDGVRRADVYTFLGAWAQQHRIVPAGDRRAHLSVGPGGWTLPIPIVQGPSGWRFDTRAGADEIRTRRIGRNELDVMNVARAYYDAQREYAALDRNGDGVLEYAQRFVSSPGRKDGLYWPTGAGEPLSPMGPATAETGPDNAYHGYRYAILTGQGKDAPGGAYPYVVGGRMIGGFGLIAWPVRYGDTGVMTFVVNHRGDVYQKDLGPGTDGAARATRQFNPDPSWQKVTPAGK